MTKKQKQEELLKAYIKSTSSLPNYKKYCDWCKKEDDKKLFTETNFSKLYWTTRSVDPKTMEGKNIIRYYKENIREGDLDLDSVVFKEDGLYIRKYGESESKKILSLDKYKKTPTLNKTVSSLKFKKILLKDYIVDFDLPINKKLHIMITKDEVHFRTSDYYIKEMFKSKKLFKIS